jgi:hypothetical protein
VQCSINFLIERMSVDQEKAISAMKGFIDATKPREMINAGSQLAQDLFPNEMASKASSVCELWDVISSLPKLPPNSDLGCVLSINFNK